MTYINHRPSFFLNDPINQLENIPRKNFLVIDTEGKELLSEIAIINDLGELIYEAFVEKPYDGEGYQIKAKSLRQILVDFLRFAQTNVIIFHHAAHDIEVLKKSCHHVKLPWPANFQCCCSWELAKFYFPHLSSYSLEYLSQYFNLQVNKQFFNPNFAHSAQYDAQFTYQLYRTILLKMMTTSSTSPQLKAPNPFGTSRVDTPFQRHPDVANIYQEQFQIIRSILGEIKYDSNHQSKGAVVIGEAGNGKTHLMMRLTQHLLPTNRLFFIRQPNNPQSVLYHIYSRILESFVEPIPNTTHSQLESLLAHSFSTIVIDILSKKEKLSQRAEMILSDLSQNALNIYQLLGSDGSEKKLNNWRLIEKLTLEWWSKTYGMSGYATSIIKGLIKYCSYSDPYYRELVRKWLAGQLLEASELEKIKLDNWESELSLEDFSLEAISVFSKLSIVDAPIIIIFDQLEGLKYDEPLLMRFGEAIKEVFTHAPNSLILFNLFPERWEYFKQVLNAAVVDRLSQYQIPLKKPTVSQLQQLLNLKAQAWEIDINILFTTQELEFICQQPSIRSVLNWASHYYRYKAEGIALPQKITTFEMEMRAELKALKRELAELKEKVGQVRGENNNQTNDSAGTISYVGYQSVIEFNQSNEINETKENSTITVMGEMIQPQIEKYLVQQKTHWEREYDKPVIISDNDDIGKVRTIAQAYKTVKMLKIDNLRLGQKKLPAHLLIETAGRSFVVAFLHGGASSFTSRIKNLNQLVAAYKDIHFGLMRDIREQTITSKGGKEEIDKLNYAPNGQFIEMDKKNRMTLETIYKMIIDIQNQDVDIDLNQALIVLETVFKDYWLIKVFQMAEKRKGDGY